jgi:hypothetical protein
MMVVVVSITMLMIVLVTQNEHRNTIDDQSEESNEDRRVEGDLHGIDKSFDAFPRHNQRKKCKQNCPGKATQRIDLSGSECVSLVMGVTPGVNIGKYIDAESGRMRAHVQTVGQQGHRTKEDAGCDFDNHHDPGNGDDNDGANLTRTFLVLPEPMAVLPRRMFIVLHHLFDTKRLMKVNCFLSESADKGE